MNRKSHNLHVSLKALLLPAVALLMVVTSCERKPLYMPVDNRWMPVKIYDMQIDLLWGLDWQAEWQYIWDEQPEMYGGLGKLGYTIPEWVRAFIYDIDPVSKKRVSQFSQNFTAKGGTVRLLAGNWYDMLFYNAGTEYINFLPDPNFEYYGATTRSSTRATYIPHTRADEIDPSFYEMPDTAKTYIDYQQPDELFGVFMRDLYVSSDPDMYDKVLDDEGNIIYVYKINALLSPYTFIYLVQVMLVNNYDETSNQPRVKGCRGITLTGLSQGVELYDRIGWTNTVSVTTDDIKELQTHRPLTLPDGTSADGDIFATRVLTWGLPGLDPIQARHELDDYGVLPQLQEDCYAGLGLVLRGGATFSVSRKISEQMAKHPAGGVITIVIDAGQIPDEIVDQKQETGGGGFDASVQGWDNEYNSEIII